MKNRLRNWLSEIVSEQVEMAVKHRRPVSSPNDTADIVRLMLDLHDEKWSFASDAFLRRMNIDPQPYWRKYMNLKEQPND